MKLSWIKPRLRRTDQTPEGALGQADLLVTCSHSVLRIQLGQRGVSGPVDCSVVARGEGLYYGLALSPYQTVCVAARRALVSDETPTETERGQIMNLAEGPGMACVLSPDRPLRDLHGIARRENTLWVVCSFDDTIGIYDLQTRKWIWWHPLPIIESAGHDQYHFNTLAFEGDLVWVLAHRRGPSWLLAFPVEAALSERTVAPVRKVELGHQAHNIWRQPDGELCTCSSIEGVLVGERGWQLETGGFPRGVASTPWGWVVGVSALKERKDRDFSEAQLKFFNNSWEQTSELTLPAVGMVLDIMAIPRTLALPVVGKQPVVVN